MSTKPTYKTTKEAKDAGWFSRRHSTSEEHQKAKTKRSEKNKKND